MSSKIQRISDNKRFNKICRVDGINGYHVEHEVRNRLIGAKRTALIVSFGVHLQKVTLREGEKPP